MSQAESNRTRRGAISELQTAADLSDDWRMASSFDRKESMSYWTEKIGWRESITTLCGWLNEIIPLIAFAFLIALWMSGAR
jgi:hypothetical protein